MKLKSVISGILACTMILGTSVFAEALRKDPKLVMQEVERPTAKENDIFFDDFANYGVGTRPSVTRWNSSSSAGSMLIGVNDVGGGIKKNCLEFTDINNSSGPQGIIDIPNPNGIVSVEFRYKCTSEEISLFRFILYGNENGTARPFAWISLKSSNRYHYYNPGGNDETPLQLETAKKEAWYHVKVYVDFNNSLVYTAFTDESTGKTTYISEKRYYADYKLDGLMQVRIASVNGLGKWVVDYVRVSQEGRLPDFPEENTDIPKGVEAVKVQGAVNHAVPDRINIKLGDKYKYLSAAPYFSDNGSIMVSVKNIANIFGLSYNRKGSEFIMKKDESSFVFKAGESKFTVDGKAVDLGENSMQKLYQLYVPLKPVAESLGYEVSYDGESKCVNIVTPSENGGE